MKKQTSNKFKNVGKSHFQAKRVESNSELRGVAKAKNDESIDETYETEADHFENREVEKIKSTKNFTPPPKQINSTPISSRKMQESKEPQKEQTRKRFGKKKRIKKRVIDQEQQHHEITKHDENVMNKLLNAFSSVIFVFNF